jgi:hypothetical protein
MKTTYHPYCHLIHDEHVENSAWRAANSGKLSVKGHIEERLTSTSYTYVDLPRVKCNVDECVGEDKVLHEISGPIID